MDRLYRVARRRHFSLAGTESLLRVGSSLNVDGLELTFPYHCGSEHSIKEYLDISPEVCALFDENETGTSLHGCKVLTRYGVSTSVGVVKKEGVLGVPALLWHPSGAACARLAPLLHACRRIKVGDVKLVYNGPSSSCDVLRPESPRLYMKDDAIDDTVWITQGLFNGVPGQAWDDKWDVIGVAFNDAYGEMDLIGRHRETKEEMPLDDLRHPTAE
ncbi:hypothetical protein AGDE_04808 [Angomonas deanei]|uniref:Uncharacterized protein n=1 Tax=Angomonas deanei TaxID=59799 RepID=A0A7G2CDR1_9TRYP|nr:hypothetical protein AGDE_04808 [Angomonas deanei]CAD2217980.1 hypothetical protein, conserved [Angomonas deanei]|eukprot:EPY39121.1 hypothetical protein AGDE_04808 [Angomonas deanei]